MQVGNGSNLLKNRNFSVYTISLTPTPGSLEKGVRILHGYPPAAGFALRGRGGICSQHPLAARQFAAFDADGLAQGAAKYFEQALDFVVVVAAFAR